ncbi:protein MODIFIER OF SNC1 1 isoform X2 [Euphorbia lathyris]|uniref:protein MODIFIER OF SNC1 1 isoform X2 n=1 Tax=Euphorbia lathyris TaxID=212925 RepID=UPI0033139340
MSSSMLSGERRWASARRGMTVLGKVAVPKPINLPSQRLENHGLDPNVEIVPKGTHSWGSKSSSSSSNAWGSSSLSPNTDGGTGSPTYLSGRPSSGGTGTRPSTAGSDRGHDPIGNAWGSSSRPSSSSGVLTSNQTSQTALRPRSAETRPGSSQLSRFAEPLSDNSVAWGGSGTSEKLGVASSKNDGFSLSTGDFPSLGSEKDNSGKNTDSQDHGSHGRPGSSSSGVASLKEHTADSAGDVSVNVNANSGGAGSWRKESSMYGEDGARPNVEKWHADPQPYPNSNIHQHFDSWHGPPVNNHPGGVWYRGPPGGPPFGSPIPPGGFPMEPFPYYHPQMPPPSLANPQPVRPPNNGPRGSHLKNGDMYRPHMHDPYVRPSMPLRPGFYPGPVPYDNYYGPPMGYCNSNERDVPFMGMAMGPAAYNRYPGQNVPDPGNPLVRPSGHGPCSNPMVSEQVEVVHPQDTRGPYKVLLKQHENWEGRDEEQKWDDNTKTNPLHSLKGEPPRKSSWENGWRNDDRMDDEMDTRRMTLAEGTSCETVDNRAVPLKVKSPENITSWNSSDESSVKKFEHVNSNFPEVLAPKDSSLIQKIEGLNAKARACDVRQDVKSVSTREEQKKKLQVGNVMACHTTNEAGDAALSHDKAYGSGIINFAPHEDHFSVADKSFESTVVGGTASARKSTHCRADHHGKLRFNTQEVDGWRKKTNVLEAQTPASCGHSEISYGPENNFEVAQNSLAHPSGKDEGESMLHVSDVNESQRAKMKELAKRIKQREKEEEERTRDQRAKALAKLEELNRRTQAGESVSQKLETAPSSVIQSRQESLTPAPISGTGSKAGAPSSSLGSNTSAVVHNKNLETVASSAVQNKEEPSIAAPPTVVSKSVSDLALDSNHSMIAQSNESNVNKVEKSASTLSNVSVETPKYAHNECAVVQEQSRPSRQDGNYVETVSSNSAHAHDVSTAKHKRTGYRQKQNSSIEKNSNDKSIPSSKTEAPKGHSDIATNATTSSGNIADEIAPNFETNLSVTTSVTSESSAHHRKKRNGKNRQKVDDAPSSLPPKESKDTAEGSGESVRPKTSETILVPSSVQSVTNLNDSNQSLELHSSLANEEGHIRLNNQWKSQHPRRMMRNQQGTKSSDKNHGADAVVWAPVRSHNRVEVSDEVPQDALVEVSVKGDQLVQNNPRNKRAEMERYVPKPVAKELSHQGSSHQAVVPSNKITSDEVVERHESGAVGVESSQTSAVSAKVGSTTESRNGDVKQSKPGKVHGSWRQRGMAESTTNPRRNFQKSFEDQEFQKIDESYVKEQPRSSDEYASDGWYMPHEIPDSAGNVHVLKDQGLSAREDQGLSARGKRHQHKSHKGMGYNHNHDEKRSVGADPAKSYMQSTAPEPRQTDSPVAAKENHAVGERSTSHWQPKTQSLPSTDQRGSQTNRSVNVEVSEGGRANKKEPARQGGSPLLPRPDRDTTSARSHQFLSEKTNFEEAPDVGRHQGPKRERRPVGRRGRPISPVELSSHSNMDVRHDQQMSAGFRRNGNANSRYSREHESHGEWSGSGKDNKQYNVPAAWERQKNNSHYEYQPVGPQNNKTNNFEPPKERPHNSGPRYRERGQSQSRRGGGNFSRRQTGGVQVDAGCE